MKQHYIKISEDTEKSFTEENPPYFDEDIPGTSENVGYPNDLVDAQGSFSDPDKALNSSSTTFAVDCQLTVRNTLAHWKVKAVKQKKCEPIQIAMKAAW